MKTQQQRQQERRQERLDLIEQQIKDGTLVVRKMTAAERKKSPPRSSGKQRRAARAPVAVARNRAARQRPCA